MTRNDKTLRLHLILSLTHNWLKFLANLLENDLNCSLQLNIRPVIIQVDQLKNEA